MTNQIRLNLSNKMNDLNFATTHENGGGRQPSTVSRYGTFSQQLFTIQGNSKKKADLGKKCFSGGILLPSYAFSHHVKTATAPN